MPEAMLPPEPELIRQTAAQVLAEGDYALSLYEPPYYDYVRSLADFFERLLRPISRFLGELHNLSPVAYYLVIIIMALALLLLLAHAYYSLRTAVARRKFAAYVPVADTSRKEPAYWESLAQQAAGNGDFITALRRLFMAGLLRLEGGKLRKAATNREYLRRYRQSKARQPLEAFVRLIDYKWYGGRECLREDWEEGQNAYRAICGLHPPAPTAKDATRPGQGGGAQGC